LGDFTLEAVNRLLVLPMALALGAHGLAGAAELGAPPLGFGFPAVARMPEFGNFHGQQFAYLIAFIGYQISTR
jgi:hypothetical protein